VGRWLFILGLALTPTAAYAHPGDHSQFGWLGLAEHLFEPDHLIFIALIILAGFAAFRAGRRAERQRQARRKQ
jgi:hydrogenase/urease accessory protein HupE